MKNNVIELSPYLPSSASVEPECPEARDTLPFFAALIESVVTVGIGICFFVGVLVSLSTML